MTLEELIQTKEKCIQHYKQINCKRFEQEEREELAFYQELQLYRTKYDKAADSLIKKCNEIDDCVFYFKKKYVSLTDVCNLIKNNDFLKGDKKE